MTFKSSELINKNLKYFGKLKMLDLGRKRENKIDNKIRDSGCTSIFKNAKYLLNLEKLYLSGNKERNKNRQ